MYRHDVSQFVRTSGSGRYYPDRKEILLPVIFQLDSKLEAFLLNVNIDTPYKNRTRIRQKLKITGSEEKLYEHLALWG